MATKKKEYNVTPTIKQENAFEKIVGENHGNISKSMRDAGYPETTAKNPKNLTESKGFQMLMEQHLPDDLLLAKHKELLNKREVTKGVDGEVIDQPETQGVSKALDMAYKIKGAYKVGDVNLQINIANLIGKYGE